MIQTSELTTLAGEQRTCNSGLTALLDDVAAGDLDAANANAAAVNQACQKAQSDFDAFQSG